MPSMTGFTGFAGVRDTAPTMVDLPHCTQEGDVLNCTMGNWTGEPDSYNYQWIRNGAAEIGEDEASYTVTADDVGCEISCIVTASNAVGSTEAPPSNAILIEAPPEEEKKPAKEKKR